ERAFDLSVHLAGNQQLEPSLLAILNAYRGLPLIDANGDARIPLYLQALSHENEAVRLAAALVILRADNTAFSASDREPAAAVAAHLALHGARAGLRHAARSVLLQSLPNGTHTLVPLLGISLIVERTHGGITIVEWRDGHVVSALLRNGS